jgi:hypothetical protein
MGFLMKIYIEILDEIKEKITDMPPYFSHRM